LALVLSYSKAAGISYIYCHLLAWELLAAAAAHCGSFGAYASETTSSWTE
jgi:hypothetical protein